MKMAELSARSGVPIPTVRFYLREGLLAPGERTSPNQAVYGAAHVRRLKLIRTLVEIGGLSIPATREVLAYMEAEDGAVVDTLGKVQYAITPRRVLGDDETDRAAIDRVDRLIATRGWRVRTDSPARTALADAVAILTRLDQSAVLDALDDYADAARSLATREVDELVKLESVDAAAEGVIAFDVLGDAMLSALRRIAQEDETTRRTDLLSRGPAAPGSPR